MNPFDAPPSTPAVSFEPPVDPPAPRRGRTVAIVLGTAGVIGAGIVGVSALASADDPELTEVPAVAADDEPTDEPTDDQPDDAEPADDADGEIRIQVGDDEPIVFDLGDEGSWGALQECLDLPMLDVLPPDLADGELPGDLESVLDELFDENGEFSGDLGSILDDLLADSPIFEEGMLDEMFDGLFDDEQLQAWLDELESFEWDTEWADGEWADGEWSDDWAGGDWLEGIDLGDQVTVLGDEGLTLIDLGDGDATVTIERDGETGELTITTDGTATEQELGEWFDDLELPALPEGEWAFPDGSLLDRLQECGVDPGQ
jgi:hypothetical protein